MPNLTHLKNGLSFIHQEMPGVGIVDVRLVLRAGAIYDHTIGLPPGTAHFLEHIVHEKTAKFDSKEDIVNLVALKGGQRNATTYTNEKMSFFATVLKEEVESAAEYVSQLTISPILTEEATEKHRSIITQEYLNKIKQPELKAWLAFRQSIFNGAGVEYMALGDVESISKISRDDMQKFFDNWFLANNSILSIYGDIDLEKAITIAERYFGPMKNNNASQGKEKGVSSQLFFCDQYSESERRMDDNSKKFSYVEIPDSQAVVYFGGMTTGRKDSRYYATKVLLQILAGDFTSVLYKILRDERHLVYHVGYTEYNADSFGTFAFILNIAPEHVQESIDIIRSEVNEIAQGEISDELITLAKTRIKAREIFANQSVQSLADNDSTTFILYPDLKKPGEWVEKIEAVTKAEIVKEGKYIVDHLNVLAVCANTKADYIF